MRKSNIKGRTITLKLRLEDFSTFTRSQTISYFVDSPQILRAVAKELYSKIDRNDLKVRLIGIGMSQLNSVSGEQLGLFEQESSLNSKMTRLLDSMKNKYGDDIIKRGTLMNQKLRSFPPRKDTKDDM
jgi:DNA polymerase-4